MNSTLKNTMEKEQQNPKMTKALFATTNDQNLPSSKSPLPYFNTPQHKKRRISIHKLLINTMQRRNHHHNNHKEKKEDSIPIKEKKSKKSKRKNKKWAKPTTLLPKKVGSILYNVFGHKKSKRGICSSSTSDEKRPNFRCRSLKEVLEMEEEKQEEFDKRKKLRGKSLKLSLSFSGFFSKKGRKSKSINRSNSDRIGAKLLMGEEEYGSKLTRAPSGYRKIRRGRSMRKKVVKSEENEDEEEEERLEDELCKKRILKGVKCKPLNLSGELHYDKNGVLLPEEVIP